MKNLQIKTLVIWLLAATVGLIFFHAAYGKLTAEEISTKNLVLAIIEVCSAVLFIVPRTSVLGTLLLVAFMGGITATKLEQEKSLWPAIFISAFVWTVSLLRNSELTQRIRNKKK